MLRGATGEVAFKDSLAAEEGLSSRSATNFGRLGSESAVDDLRRFVGGET